MLGTVIFITIFDMDDPSMTTKTRGHVYKWRQSLEEGNLVNKFKTLASCTSNDKIMNRYVASSTTGEHRFSSVVPEPPAWAPPGN